MKKVLQEAPVNVLKASLVIPAAILEYPPLILANAFSNKMTHNSPSLEVLNIGFLVVGAQGT